MCERTNRPNIYGRKRSDQSTAKHLVRRGPSTYGKNETARRDLALLLNALRELLVSCCNFQELATDCRVFHSCGLAPNASCFCPIVPRINLLRWVHPLHRCVRMSRFRSFSSPALLAHQPARCPLNRESMMPDSVELRKRAEWYREFAERAGVPWIWEARLKTAKQLEAEAVRIESKHTLEQARDDLPSPVHLVDQPNARNPSL
jgi:hypothetical protein